MCVKDKADRNRWLAAILNMKVCVAVVTLPDWSSEKRMFIGFISAVMARDSYMRFDRLAMKLIGSLMYSTSSLALQQTLLT